MTGSRKGAYFVYAMSNKTQKHQPNIRALIHNFCNGVNSPMQCGNVTSGGGALWSYSLQIAERREINGREIFGIYSNKYSVTTSKHTRFVWHSIPLNASSLRSAKLIDDKFEPVVDFKKIEEVEKEAWNDKQYSHAFDTGNRGQLNADGYHAICKDIKATLDAMSNPRVSRFTKIEVMMCYWEILRARRFRKAICPSEKPFNFGNVRKILSDYQQRLLVKFQKAEAEERRKQAKVVDTVERNMEGLKRICEEWNRFEKAKGEAWRQHREVSYNESMYKLSEEFEQIASLNRVDRHAMKQVFEEKAGMKFSHSHRYTSEAMLRINGDEIETSKGARLPLGIAKGLWKRHGGLVEAIANGDASGGQFPIMVGPFQWYGAEDKTLVIGCHRIPATEVQRLAKDNNW